MICYVFGAVLRSAGDMRAGMFVATISLSLSLYDLSLSLSLSLSLCYI